MILNLSEYFCFRIQELWIRKHFIVYLFSALFKHVGTLNNLVLKYHIYVGLNPDSLWQIFRALESKAIYISNNIDTWNGIYNANYCNPIRFHRNYISSALKWNTIYYKTELVFTSICMYIYWYNYTENRQKNQRLTEGNLLLLYDV